MFTFQETKGYAVEIRLRLMGMLKPKTPSGERFPIAGTATIADVLGQLGIPLDSVQVFTVNGKLVRDQQHQLADGDELTVLPPVGGG